MTDQIDNAVITPRFLIKAGSSAVVILTGIITVVLYIASLKADISALRETVQTNEHEYAEHQRENDKQFDRLRTHSEQQDKAVSDLGRKLDVAVAILERIDKKVNP